MARRVHGFLQFFFSIITTRREVTLKRQIKGGKESDAHWKHGYHARVYVANYRIQIQYSFRDSQLHQLIKHRY